MAVGAGVNGGRARRGDVTPQAGGDLLQAPLCRGRRRLYGVNGGRWRGVTPRRGVPCARTLEQGGQQAAGWARSCAFAGQASARRRAGREQRGTGAGRAGPGGGARGATGAGWARPGRGLCAPSRCRAARALRVWGRRARGAPGGRPSGAGVACPGGERGRVSRGRGEGAGQARGKGGGREKREGERGRGKRKRKKKKKMGKRK